MIYLRDAQKPATLQEDLWYLRNVAEALIN